MDNPNEAAQADARRIGKALEPFLVNQFIEQLSDNVWMRNRAACLLELLRQDTKHELSIRPLDFFLGGHLNKSTISEAAHDRSIDKEGDYPHLKACSVCNAFVEVEAARLIVKRNMSVSLSGLHAKVPEAPTDNQKWFGRTPGSRL